MATNYFKVHNRKGQFYLTSKEPMEGAEKVETEKYGTRYHLFKKELEGRLNFVNYSNKFGETFTIFLDLPDDNSVGITIPLDGMEARNFITALYNAPTDQPIKIQPYKSEAKNGKTYTNFSVTDSKGEKVQWLEETPPPPVEKRAGVWDFTDQQDWVFKKFEELKNRVYTKKEEPAPTPKREDNDELPF